MLALASVQTNEGIKVVPEQHKETISPSCSSGASGKLYNTFTD